MISSGDIQSLFINGWGIVVCMSVKFKFSDDSRVKLNIFLNWTVSKVSQEGWVTMTENYEALVSYNIGNITTSLTTNRWEFYSLFVCHIQIL